MAETVREHKFDQVKALLNKADDPRTPADEADTARKLAEKLMLRHAFDEEEIRQAAVKNGGQVESPEIRKFNIYDSGNAFSWVLNLLFIDLVAHCRCRRATGGWDDRTRYFYVVGFASDLDFLDLLYTIVRLAFSSNIEPPYDENDYDGSVARMHLAGITWREIARRTGTPWPDGQKLRRAFYRWADANGVSKDEGHRRSPSTYRESFAEGFLYQMENRLYVMRQAAADEARAETGERFAIALRSREDRVEEFLYERFPGMRPKVLTDEERAAIAKRLADAPKPKGRQPTYRPPKRDERAMAAGASAANRVNLSGSSGVRDAGRRELG
jgi:Protein of unknown function (DUF2786)